MAWGDLDQDGDLNLVTATYDAGMLTERGNEYLLSNSGGVFVYTNNEGRFRPEQLANEARGWQSPFLTPTAMAALILLWATISMYPIWPGAIRRRAGSGIALLPPRHTAP